VNNTHEIVYALSNCGFNNAHHQQPWLFWRGGENRGACNGQGHVDVDMKLSSGWCQCRFQGSSNSDNACKKMVPKPKVLEVHALESDSLPLCHLSFDNFRIWASSTSFGNRLPCRASAFLLLRSSFPQARCSRKLVAWLPALTNNQKWASVNPNHRHHRHTVRSNPKPRQPRRNHRRREKTNRQQHLQSHQKSQNSAKPAIVRCAGQV